MIFENVMDRTARLIQSDLYPTLSRTEIVSHLATQSVVLAGSEADLRSTSAQTCLVATYIMLAQLGVRVELDIPDVALNGPQPPLDQAGLKEALLELSTDLVIPAVSRRGPVAGMVVVVGNAQYPEAAATLRLGGDAWNGVVLPSRSDTVKRFSGGVPFGALLAASAAAAEVFRGSMKRLGSAHALTPPAEFDLGEGSSIRMSVPPVAHFNADFGHIDFVSAGAITNACLFTLLRLPGAAADVRLIDFDRAAESNLNRYPLLRRSMLEKFKVDAFSTYGSSRFAITPVRELFTIEALGRILPLAPRVLVGVDDIPSRWLVQRQNPEWLCVAGTTHFHALVSEHSADTPCAGCLHPRDDTEAPREIPTISFVSMIAGVLQAHRLLAANSGASTGAPLYVSCLHLGAPRAVCEIGLAPNPGCPVGCTTSRVGIAA